MKAFVCDLCGSNELLKEGEYFVCQYCHTKYSKDEVQKMMIEGTVDIQGTVRVDNSAYVEKYLQNARRAKEKEDWSEVEKYYNMVEQNDPDNIEAIFYSAYGKAKESLNDGDIFKREAAFKVLVNSISILDDHYLIERRKENKDIIIRISTDISHMFFSGFVYNRIVDGYFEIRNDKDKTYNLFAYLLAAYRETMINIMNKDNQLYLHEIALFVYINAINADFCKKNILNDWIKAEEGSIEIIKNTIIKKYWEDNKVKREKLDNEKKDVENQIKEQEKLINNLPEAKELKIKTDNINKLINESKDISIFKIKEKFSKTQDILAAKVEKNEYNRIYEKACEPYNKEIDKLRYRIEEINNIIVTEPLEEHKLLTDL